MSAAVAPSQIAALPIVNENTSQPHDVLDMHKDRISAAELDLSDAYVASSLGLFAIHNIVRRNLASCAAHAKNVKKSNEAHFLTYAKYTLYVLEDQLQAVDLLWFPEFAKYDSRFSAQIKSHSVLFEQVSAVRELLEQDSFSEKGEEVSVKFQSLSEAVNEQYDVEERLCNELGHKVPLDTIKELEKQQEDRRKAQVKTYGHLWTALYVLRGLSPKEREIFPPGIPKVVVSGMLTAGSLQYRRELQFAPKF